MKRFFNRTNTSKMAGWTILAAMLAVVLSLGIPRTGHGSDHGGGGGEGRSGGGPAEVVSVEVADIQLDDLGIMITDDRDIELAVQFQGIPDFYTICENPQFTDCEWKRFPMDGRIRYLLSEGSGLKKIYLRARYLGRPGSVKVVTVKYQPK